MLSAANTHFNSLGTCDLVISGGVFVRYLAVYEKSWCLPILPSTLSPR